MWPMWAKKVSHKFLHIFHKVSVVMQLRCGGIRSNQFTTNFPQNALVKIFLNIGQYLATTWTKICGLFFGHPVHTHTPTYITYSLASLSRPPLSRQPRFSPPVAAGWIFFHVIYLINSPPSRLALTNWWIDNDLSKLHPISRHSRFVVASLSVPAIAPVSGMFIWTVAHWPSEWRPLPLTIPWNPTASSAAGMSVTPTACDEGQGRAPITAFIHSTGVWLQWWRGREDKEVSV